MYLTNDNSWYTLYLISIELNGIMRIVLEYVDPDFVYLFFVVVHMVTF